jgi:Cu(I)/Ag(I) efflux system membrane fusion protein
MSRLLLLGILLASLSGCSSVEQRIVSSLFQNYISAQEALAADNFDEAKQSLNQLIGEVDGEVKEIAAQAADAKDISEVRAAFKSLSAEMAKMEVPEGYVVAFCPMADEGKGATWVQKDEEIANPYFGAAMLRCGTKQTKN